MTSVTRLVIVALLGVSLLGCRQDRAQAAATKEATIREFLQVTGIVHLAIQNVKEAYENSSTAQRLGSKYTEYWSEFTNSARIEDLQSALVPIYAKNFEQAELEELIKFYKTPVGQKFVAKTRQIGKESSKAVVAWANRVTDAFELFLEEHQYK